MLLEENISLNIPLCQKCGGRCCQGSPGIWIDPARFFATFAPGESLTLAGLNSRLDDLELTLWEKSGVPIPAPMSRETGCAFLESDGCRLSVAERPCQCLTLIPSLETLNQRQGCLCRQPEGFSRDVAHQRWLAYWQAVRLEGSP